MTGHTAHGIVARRSDPTTQLAELFTHTARRLRRGSSAQLAPLGVTYAQARTLRLVAEDGPMRMADLAARLEVVPRSVTTMVDALERTGLVARHTDRDDRRSVLVAPTAEGRRLIERLDRARRQGAADVFGSLTPGERDKLLRLLGRLCERGSCVSCSGPPGVHAERDTRPAPGSRSASSTRRGGA
jgi:DNA-binding MarR family transcriptional regulator